VAGYKFDDSMDACTSSVGQGFFPMTDEQAVPHTDVASADCALIAPALNPSQQTPAFEDEGPCLAAGNSAQTNAPGIIAAASPSGMDDRSDAHAEAVNVSAVHREAAGLDVHEGKDEAASVDATVAADGSAQMPDSGVPGKASGKASDAVTTAEDAAQLASLEHETRDFQAEAQMKFAGEGIEACGVETSTFSSPAEAPPP
jgi:hypothetical protein